MEKCAAKKSFQAGQTECDLDLFELLNGHDL